MIKPMDEPWGIPWGQEREYPAENPDDGSITLKDLHADRACWLGDTPVGSWVVAWRSEDTAWLMWAGKGPDREEAMAEARVACSEAGFETGELTAYRIIKGE